MRIILFLALVSFSARADLIRPELTELSNFVADWCAPSETQTPVREVCLGSASFGETESLRAFTFARADGSRDLYIESDFRGVELLKRSFEITGPLSGGLVLGAELGQATVGIDARGEVDSVTVESARLGRLFARRRISAPNNF